MGVVLEVCTRYLRPSTVRTRVCDSGCQVLLLLFAVRQTEPGRTKHYVCTMYTLAEDLLYHDEHHHQPSEEKQHTHTLTHTGKVSAIAGLGWIHSAELWVEQPPPQPASHAKAIPFAC